MSNAWLHGSSFVLEKCQKHSNKPQKKEIKILFQISLYIFLKLKLMFKICLVYSKAQRLLYVILAKLVQFRQVAPSKFSRCATLKSKLEKGLFSLGV